MKAAVACLFAVALAARAFSPAITEADGLRLEIPAQEPWTALDQARDVTVRLTNVGAEPLRGRLRVGLADAWRVDGEPEQPFDLRPGAEATLSFAVLAGRGTYSAHYPIHATASFQRNGGPATVHTVLVIEAKLPTVTGGRPAERSLTALRAPGPMLPDGQLGEWAAAAPVDLGAADATVGAPDATDFAARVMALWDDTALFLAVQATDDQLAGGDVASRDFVDSDYVRVTLSPAAPASRAESSLGAQDLVLAIAPGAAGGPAVKLVNYEGTGRTDFDLRQVRAATAADAAGWRLEVAIPWTALGGRPAAGDVRGLNLQLGDTDAAGREAELCLGGTQGQYWTDPRQAAALRFSNATSDPGGGALPVASVPERGVLALARLRPGRVTVEPYNGEPRTLPYGATADPESRAQYEPSMNAVRGETRTAIQFHPPWSGGLAGRRSAYYRLALPATTPLMLRFGMAIRDTSAAEPPSDGVTFGVQVAPEGGAFETVYEHHTTATAWDDAQVDLSAYAGQVITLRLVGDPGPKHDTTCDGAFWGGPSLRAGAEPPVEDEAEKAARRLQALDKAGAMLRGGTASGAWRVDGEAGTVGVSLVPGPRGLLDAQIAFAGEQGTLVYDGFAVDIDGAPLGELLDGPEAVTAAAVERRPDSPIEVRHAFHSGRIGGVATARVEATAQGLRIAWSMPGIERTPRGEPWFTRLSLGPCSQETFRVFYGHGNVIQGAPRFAYGYGGFSLSTRFAGVEYAGGLALVSSIDPIPDRIEHDQARRVTTLVGSGDCTFDLIASTKGAFAGARAWRLLWDLPAAPGVAAIRGKMCLDQWGGDYAEAAEGLRLATAYGLDEAVFVKHVWQRWGYDYRLPDIFPPAGDREAFDAMAAAAQLNGRLFAPHDNYIDFYPDAEGFTYDAIEFMRNGEPQRAWFNEGREAQSYRWLPTAFWPFLERNLRLMEDAFDPSALFIDVFSAMAPHDCYDRQGRFVPKTVDQEWWGRAFDRTREVIGGPTISEAGHDALIGHLDAAQADHIGISRDGGDFNHRLDFEQTDRIPWFDMGHHGRFVQFAGGLGNRYAGGASDDLHGYASDDYLSLTVLCGRTPMCDGPFGRGAVMTYWLLQPICGELENQEMLAHAFVGDSVRRQRVTWSDGEVTVNRGAEDITAGGVTLPEYGFVARAGAHRADISRRDGVISAFSSGPGMLFADARPPDRYSPERAAIAPTVTGFEATGPRTFRLTMSWRVDRPARPVYSMFVHLCGSGDLLPGWQPNSDILFQAGANWRPEIAATVGEHSVTVNGTLPDELLPGTLQIKYGLYNPQNGGRLTLRGPGYGDQRYDGGAIAVEGAGDQTRLAWTPSGRGETGPRQNSERKVLDFGPIATNGAMRLLYGEAPWKLVLMPGSAPAQVTLRLDQLGAAGRRVAAVEQIDVDGAALGEAAIRQEGDQVSFETADQAFAYRITVR